LLGEHMVERENFLIESHRELLTVLGCPGAEVGMLGDEVCFLLELAGDDVPYTACV